MRISIDVEEIIHLIYITYSPTSVHCKLNDIVANKVVFTLYDENDWDEDSSQTMPVKGKFIVTTDFLVKELTSGGVESINDLSRQVRQEIFENITTLIHE